MKTELRRLITTPAYCRQCQGKSCPDCKWRGWVMTEMTRAELRQALRPDRTEDQMIELDVQTVPTVIDEVHLKSGPIRREPNGKASLRLDFEYLGRVQGEG